MRIKEEHTKGIEAFVARAVETGTHDPEKLKSIIQRIFDNTEEEVFLRVDMYVNREKIVAALVDEGYTVRVLKVKGNAYDGYHEVVFKPKKYSGA